MSRYQISDAVGADVNDKSVVSFNVKSFRLRSLSYGKAAKKLNTRFTFQIKVYFGCGGLLLKIPDRMLILLDLSQLECLQWGHDMLELQT